MHRYTFEPPLSGHSRDPDKCRDSLLTLERARGGDWPPSWVFRKFYQKDFI